MSDAEPSQTPEPGGASDPPPDSRTTTAYHEAGHAVMATMLGRPIQKVSIAPGKMQFGGDRLGVCQMQKGGRKTSRDWLEDEVMILFAGMVAEAHFTGQYCRSGASEDLRSVHRLVRTRPGSDRQLARIERRYLDKTEHTLADDAVSEAIRSVAEELIAKTTISGRAVRHFLEQATQRAAKE